MWPSSNNVIASAAAEKSRAGGRAGGGGAPQMHAWRTSGAGQPWQGARVRGCRHAEGACPCPPLQVPLPRPHLAAVGGAGREWRCAAAPPPPPSPLQRPQALTPLGARPRPRPPDHAETPPRRQVAPAAPAARLLLAPAQAAPAPRAAGGQRKCVPCVPTAAPAQSGEQAEGRSGAVGRARTPHKAAGPAGGTSSSSSSSTSSTSTSVGPHSVPDRPHLPCRSHLHICFQNVDLFHVQPHTLAAGDQPVQTVHLVVCRAGAAAGVGHEVQGVWAS